MYTDYAIDWNTLEISTTSSNGPRFIMAIINYGNGPHAQYINADGHLWAHKISEVDAARFVVETYAAAYDAADYGLGEGLER